MMPPNSAFNALPLYDYYPSAVRTLKEVSSLDTEMLTRAAEWRNYNLR